jgi:hypothetical protein
MRKSHPNNSFGSPTGERAEAIMKTSLTVYEYASGGTVRLAFHVYCTDYQGVPAVRVTFVPHPADHRQTSSLSGKLGGKIHGWQAGWQAEIEGF